MADISASGTDIQIATDASFHTCLVDESREFCGSRFFNQAELPYGVDLYARVRHKHTQTGVSNWSKTIGFQLVVPGDIIGICLDNSGTRGVFYWIDALGNRVSTFDYLVHPIFDGITMASVDLRSPVIMTKIPLFFVKTAASGPVGTFAAGKKCWWISNFASEGYHPAACFKRTMQKSADGKYIISPHCYIGTYLGHYEYVGDVETIGSQPGSMAATYAMKDNFKAYISSRDDASIGLTGFRMFDIWDMGALRLLMLIAKANANVQSAFGDNSAGESYPRTGSTGARLIFKGTTADPQVSIEDLWRCYWYFVDLISINKGAVTLTNPMDLKSPISFGTASSTRYKQTTTSGWLKDVLDCPFVIGDDTHDLMELFLPKTTNSSESRGTFFDYHDASTISSTTDVVVGGYATSTRSIPTSGSGLFRTQFFSTLYTEALVEGVRICKN